MLTASAPFDLLILLLGGAALLSAARSLLIQRISASSRRLRVSGKQRTAESQAASAGASRSSLPGSLLLRSRVPDAHHRTNQHRTDQPRTNRPRTALSKTARGGSGSSESEQIHAVSELLRSLASLAAAGLPFAQALKRAAEAGEEASADQLGARAVGRSQAPSEVLRWALGRAAEAENLGLDPVPVLLTAIGAEPSGLVRRVGAEAAACWHLARTSGMPLGPLLASLAEAASERAEAEEAAAAALAAPAATARLLMWLPLIGAGLGCVLLGAAWWRALFSPLGLLLLALGCLLMLAGRLWSGRIVRAAREVSIP